MPLVDCVRLRQKRIGPTERCKRAEKRPAIHTRLWNSSETALIKRDETRRNASIDNVDAPWQVKRISKTARIANNKK